ncbi:membrane protein [Clostridium scatologenes]|uniref:Glucose/Sorbosone dehydrogenase domain-containing protein n=1 Tax=Clostridium scatologenes TaxID=1548 RepID=A0A0E3JXZ1_CLOSL|nr:membrane protein [Clostridium scatologenes]AKA68455.1 hypothetical protein CSCA_1330 [Clostridium scatologenes]
MKKFFKILLLFFCMIFIIIIIKKHYYNDYSAKNLNMNVKDLKYNIKYKGLKSSVDFTMDNDGNYYIAYKDKIQIIKDNGKSYYLFKNSNLNICSIEYFNNKLYFSSDTKIYCYDIKNNKTSEIVKDIPNYGDYKNSIIKVRGNYLYISVGSATNSGVVGEDNKWIKENPYSHDISPKDITLKGINFGKFKTGAYQSCKTKSIKGQIIPEHFPGNSSILIYNLNTGNMETMAWGIRNVTGMDFTSEGKLIAAIGGMEDRGVRPVKGDTDYIYEIRKNTWYGWPDYSGGDPVTSPKFRGKANSMIQFILENHPTTNPPAPLYQHKTLSSIKSLVVDNNGVLSIKNAMYFYDITSKILYKFNGAGAVEEEAKFNRGDASSLKFYEKSLLILDGKEGYLYSIEKGNINNVLKVNKSIYFYLLALVVVLIVILLKFEKKLI